MQTEKNPQKKLGTGFWLAAWVCLLIVLVSFFNDELLKQQNPNTQVERRSENGVPVVTLKRNRAGHYVANGYINNQPVTFLVDTGATNVAIPAEIADRIGLRRGQEYISITANGKSVSYATRLDSLELGSIYLTDISAGISPGFKSNQILLGMSALKQLEFTQRGDTLTLKQF